MKRPAILLQLVCCAAVPCIAGRHPRQTSLTSLGRGKGTFTILYCDDSLRLLRGSSSSSLVVQIRADALRQLLGKRRLALEGQ